MISMSAKRNAAPMTMEQVIANVPAVAAVNPYPEVSKRYAFVPTTTVIDILKNEGWLPFKAEQAGVRNMERSGFQKHMIRFRHPELDMGDETVEAVLVNSHDRSCAFKFFSGIFRFLCSNGMIVGDTFESVSVRHVGFNTEAVIEASKSIIEHAPQVAGAIGDMKAIELSRDERGVFAMSAQDLLYENPEEESPIPAWKLLDDRRYEDDKPDLWTVYNKVQENIMRGGIHGVSKKTGRRVTTRPVKAIDRNVQLNRALFTLADEMRKLKTPC